MRTVIVTGASGNLGQAIIRRFLSAGDSVIGIISRKKETPFDKEPGFEAFAADLTSEKEVTALMSSLLGKYPVIDVAVLTAGGFAMGKIKDTGAEELSQQYRLNFETTYFIGRLLFLQMMKQKTGRIFLTGSKPGLDMKNGKGITAYALSKSLIFRFAELMNEEAKGSSVVTSVIVPSTIDTPENRSAMPDADFKKWVKPESIAEVVFSYCDPSFEIVREPVIKVYNQA